METRTVILGLTVASIILFTLGATVGWFFASPPPTYKQVTTGNLIQLKLGLVPVTITDVDLTGWNIIINLKGYYNKPLDTQLDYYIATKNGVTLEDYSLSGIIQQIKENQTP